MNKKLKLAFLLSVLLPFIALSQSTNTEKRIKIGIQTGGNFAFVNRFGPYVKDDQGSVNFVRVRANASFFISYQLFPFLRLQTGIGYANYGGQYREEAGTVYNSPSAGNTNGSTSTYYFKDIYRMDFMEIPLMAKFFMLPKKQISPYITIGMSYGSLLRASNYYNFNDVNTMEMDDIKPYVNKYFINCLAGMGVEFFKRKRISLGLDIRYHQSLTKVFSSRELDYVYPDADDPNYENATTYNVETYYHNIFVNVFSSVNF